jgi:hypothetical protein
MTLKRKSGVCVCVCVYERGEEHDEEKEKREEGGSGGSLYSVQNRVLLLKYEKQGGTTQQ